MALNLIISGKSICQPVVGELQLKSCMIRSFDDDDVSHEIGSEQETQASDVVRFLRSAT